MKQKEIKKKIEELIAENERLEEKYEYEVAENEREMRAYFDSLVLEYKEYHDGSVDTNYEFKHDRLCDELTGGCGDYDWSISYDKLTRENLDKTKEEFFKRRQRHISSVRFDFLY